MSEGAARRRQVSLFVPHGARAVLDDVRARADPVQHGLIPAHVTLVRDEDVADWGVVRGRLAGLADLDLRLVVTGLELEHWGGAYLRLDDPDGAFAACRANLLGDQPGRDRIQTPHVTLMHPRNRATFGMDPAELRGVVFPEELRFGRATFIEQFGGGPWRIVEESPGPT